MPRNKNNGEEQRYSVLVLSLPTTFALPLFEPSQRLLLYYDQAP